MMESTAIWLLLLLGADGLYLLALYLCGVLRG